MPSAKADIDESETIDSLEKAKQAEALVGPKKEEQIKVQPGKPTLWHESFGHVHSVMIVHMYMHNTLHGLGLQSHAVPKAPCERCVMGKNARKHSRSSGLHRGPKNQLSFFYKNVRRAHYFVLFKDDFLEYRNIYCI